MKLDHIYIKVRDLDEAIALYEQIFNTKISNREGNRWADFNVGSGVYLGILNVTVDGEEVSQGDNVTPSIKSSDIESDHKKIGGLQPKTITDIITLTQPHEYRYFQFEDKWGNVWEVAEYDY